MRISTREQLSTVLAGNRSPGDRVAAIGAAQLFEHHMRQSEQSNQAARDSRYVSIGMTTMAVKNGLRATLFERAIDEVADEYLQAIKTPISESAARTVSRAALHQHILDMCQTCHGKKEVPDHDVPHLEGAQPMKTCPSCEGTGKRTYSAAESADALNGAVDRSQARASIDKCLEIIQRAERLAIRHWAMVLK